MRTDDTFSSCPSVTAWRVAQMRAAHQVHEGGAIFADPFAVRIVGEVAPLETPETARAARSRTFIAWRSRIAEDALQAARARGLRQIVVLGAGLDTTGLRHGDALAVFEVDRQDMQDWKRAWLHRAGIGVPEGLRFVPVDFERDDLGEALWAADIRRDLAVFFVWLGVVPYLTMTAIKATLGLAAAFPEAEVVFDYVQPASAFQEDAQALLAQRAAAVAALAAVGEPWISYFKPVEIEALVRDAGFDAVRFHARDHVVHASLCVNTRRTP